MGSTRIHQVLLRFNWVLHDKTWFHKILLGFTEFDSVLLGFHGLNLFFFTGITGF